MVAGSIWDALKPVQSDLQHIRDIVADLNVQMKVLDVRIRDCETALEEVKSKPRTKKKTEDNLSNEL